jgi:hypothetical protein
MRLAACLTWHAFFRNRLTMESGAKIVERIEEALREIAALFIALAPLDVFLGEGTPHAVRNGLIFVGIGLMMFLVALFVERKRSSG